MIDENRGKQSIFGQPARPKIERREKQPRIDKAIDTDATAQLAQLDREWLRVENPAIWTQL